MISTPGFDFEEVGEASFCTQGHLDLVHLAVLTDSTRERPDPRIVLHFKAAGLFVSVQLTDSDLVALSQALASHVVNVNKAEEV